MREIIKNFPKQFGDEPEIQNFSKLKKFERVIVSGMGGSGLVAPLMHLENFRDYGLPKGDLKNALVICNSYS